MSLGKTFFVTCDVRRPGCARTTASSLPLLTSREARSFARQKGWLRRRLAATEGFQAEYEDVCPHCRRAPGEDR